jgi:hypothetical protein
MGTKKQLHEENPVLDWFMVKLVNTTSMKTQQNSAQFVKAKAP